jgi:hypothetical protein
MKLAVIGSRGLSVSVVDVLLELQAVGVQLSDIELIISGGAVGVDFVANELSDTLGVPLRVCVPDYTRDGHRAPFIRNNDIIKNSDFVLAFWDGESKGTAYTLKVAVNRGIPCKIIRISSHPQLSLF